MNFDKKGFPIALYYNSTEPDKKKKEAVLYLNNEPDDLNNNNNINEIKLTKKNEILKPYPNISRERDILYITGSSGSGKSFYTRQYIENYHKEYPKRPVYIFSSLDEDSTLDKLPYIKRIKLNQEFLNTDFTLDDFKNMLIVFDDTDCISNKELKNKMDGILNKLLETGRHTNTSVIYTSHLPTQGLATRRILNEAHTITFFPHGTGEKSIKYLLENYLGLDREQRKKLKRLPSRWATFIKSYPNALFHEKGAYLLNNTD
jgi:hypothetical protein